MLVKFHTILIILIAVLYPVHIFAQEQQLPNVGFVSQNIWYSEQKFFANDKIVIHAVITSSGEYDFSGIVKFYDGRNLIGTSDFLIKTGVYVKDVQINWNATYGNHSINAVISDSKIVVEGKEVLIAVSNSEAKGKDSFVDFDTDGDRIGDMEDLDDDGDGISDEEELRMGTDPLKKEIVNNEVTEAYNTSTTTSLNSIVQKAGDVAENSVLPVASSVAQKAFALTEDARNAQKKFADKKIVKVREDIAEEKKKKESGEMEEDGFNTRTPFKYTSLLALTFLSYTSRYAVLYYGLMGIAVIYFLLILWRRWRNRGY